MLRSNLNLPEAIKADLVFVISGVLGFSWSHTLKQLSKTAIVDGLDFPDQRLTAAKRKECKNDPIHNYEQH